MPSLGGRTVRRTPGHPIPSTRVWVDDARRQNTKTVVYAPEVDLLRSLDGPSKIRLPDDLARLQVGSNHVVRHGRENDQITRYSVRTLYSWHHQRLRLYASSIVPDGNRVEFMKPGDVAGLQYGFVRVGSMSEIAAAPCEDWRHRRR